MHWLKRRQRLKTEWNTIVNFLMEIFTIFYFLFLISNFTLFVNESFNFKLQYTYFLLLNGWFSNINSCQIISRCNFKFLLTGVYTSNFAYSLVKSKVRCIKQFINPIFYYLADLCLKLYTNSSTTHRWWPRHRNKHWALSVRCNNKARRFARCSSDVKIALLKPYSQSLY